MFRIRIITGETLRLYSGRAISCIVGIVESDSGTRKMLEYDLRLNSYEVLQCCEVDGG